MAAKTVADKSPAVLAMEKHWALVGSLLGGTDTMRAAGEALLPKWPNEDDKDYDFRRKVSVLFPAYTRTVETLTGKPFSKPITVGEDVPEQIQALLDDVDLQGRNLDAFASDIMEAALGFGLAGILVEFPDANEAAVERNAQGVTTMAAERKAGLRPYLVQIRCTQILGWKARREKGEWKLLQLRFFETVEQDDGEFGAAEVTQIRVLEPGKWSTYRKGEGTQKDEWIQHKKGVTTLDFVPFVPVYGKRLGFMVAKPPMLELAHLNVKHWQSQSDQDNLLHVARVPILTIIGIDDEKWKLTVGSSAAVKLPMNADMKFTEHSGAAITAGKTSLDDLKEEMRQAGAELLVIKPGVITATEVTTENAVGMCALQRIVQGLEDALDLALQYMAEWLKLEQGGHVTLFNDFGAATLAEASAQLLLESAKAGKISDETYHGELQRRGILSPDVDWDTEKDRIEEQGPALGTLPDPTEDPNRRPEPAGA
ncbi:DUF4055 domain-containing protein [Caldimonas sp. KR1-144]|uniref:DUF4055 domain-containing protein n=1 Tax=Caldimonas sp. KR1-144 TaxID=3400911 RepID=UPI003C096435